jgi:hypothetical protein
MSRRDRRDPNDVDTVFTMIQLVCFRDEEHHIGKVVRQRGRDMLEVGLNRIDGPSGETKVAMVCPVCSPQGDTAAPQVRWDRLSAMLDEMELNGEKKRIHAPR